MTDNDEALELFDTAKAEFPSRFDLKDRLCLIWVTGRNGKRKGENGEYDWFDTYTLVLDDPNGSQDWNGKVFDTEKETERDTLVPSVVQTGEPQLLKNFQYSFGGMTARLSPRVSGQVPATYKPMLGRINSRPNKRRGMAASWSVAEPTADEVKFAMNHASMIAEVTEMVKAYVASGGSAGSADDSAFS